MLFVGYIVFLSARYVLMLTKVMTMAIRWQMFVKSMARRPSVGVRQRRVFSEKPERNACTKRVYNALLPCPMQQGKQNQNQLIFTNFVMPHVSATSLMHESSIANQANSNCRSWVRMR